MKKLILPISICLTLAACGDSTTRTEENKVSVVADSVMSQPVPPANPEISTALKTGMDKMTTELRAYAPTGDPDHDYAALMRIHHHGGIEMMQAYLSGAKDEMLKNMAQNGIVKQQSEISELEAFLNGHKPGTQKNTYGKEALQMLMDMMQMDSHPADADKAFAAMMAPHHESAVHISQMYLNQGKNQKLKDMARKIATEQQKETDELKNWLQAHL